MLAYFLLCQACQSVSSGIPIKAEFQVSVLSRLGVRLGEIEIKAKLGPAVAGV